MAEQLTLTGSPAQRRDLEQEAQKPLVPPDSKREGVAQTESLEEHYAGVIGAFQDDPMLDAMMAHIRARRRELDADSATE